MPRRLSCCPLIFSITDYLRFIHVLRRLLHQMLGRLNSLLRDIDQRADLGIYDVIQCALQFGSAAPNFVMGPSWFCVGSFPLNSG